MSRATFIYMEIVSNWRNWRQCPATTHCYLTEEKHNFLMRKSLFMILSLNNSILTVSDKVNYQAAAEKQFIQCFSSQFLR